jgi:hypothetical protein
MADERSRPPYSSPGGDNQPSLIPAQYAWPALLVRDGDELFDHYRHTLEALGGEKGTLALIFNKAQNKFQDPAKLRRVIVDLINEEDWSSMGADVKGDAYEGLLEKNALDFHIAFYLGRLLQEHVGNGSPERKTAKFIVVSKDGGFDTLLSHVQALGHTAMKAATIREALGLGAAKKVAAAKNVANDKNMAAAKKSAPPKVVPSTKQVETPEAVPQKKAKADVRLKLVANFREYPKSRPSTRAALERHIGTALGGAATPSAVQDLIAALERAGVLKVSGDKVEYAAS